MQVRLPGRALGTVGPPPSGWIPDRDVVASATAWHIVVRLRTRRVVLYGHGVRRRDWPAIIGAAATPTPRGSFFVEENVRLDASAAGAPFALALSARSSVYQEFAGGPGQIALHGLRGVGGRLGTAGSHGCTRLSTRSITRLAALVRPGTPVTIR